MTTLIEHPATARHRLRLKLEATIDKLICALDQIDGDPDMEDSDEDDQCEDEGAVEVDDDSENEADLCGIGFQAPHGVYHQGAMHHDLELEDGI